LAGGAIERSKKVTRHKTTNVDGLSVFYREAGDLANPKLLLLGGFPAAHPDPAFDELLEYPGGNPLPLPLDLPREPSVDRDDLHG
jgi:hypothetical protein